MNIPTPDEFAKDHGHNPFPPRWERWLGAARAGILSAQPVAGRHVSTDEHPGKGTVINVERPAPTPVCAETISIEITDLSIRTDCIPAGFCDPSFNGVQYSDIALNGSLELDNEDLIGWCPDDSTPAGCIWDGNKIDSFHYEVCEGSPFNESDLTASWSIAHMDGVWFIIGEGGVNIGSGFSQILFYAESASITSPISNLLTVPSSSCGDTFLGSNRFFDVWFGDCSPGSGDQTVTVIATGGTVTVTI